MASFNWSQEMEPVAKSDAINILNKVIENEIAEHQGNANRVFIAGHHCGGEMAMYVAFKS